MFDLEQYRNERRELIDSEIDRFSGLLAQRENITQVILFGGCAAGDIHAFSDIDLMVIMDTDKGFFDRLDELYLYLQPRIQTDILAYTPHEFEALRKNRNFVRHAVETGRVIVEK